MNNKNLIDKLNCNVINSNLEIMSLEEKEWFFLVISLILKTFPNIDIYATDANYIGFGKKELGAYKVEHLLLVCHFDCKNSIARFHVCVNTKTENLINILKKTYDDNITFEHYGNIDKVQNWLEDIKVTLSDNHNQYIGNGYFPSDYKEDDNLQRSNQNNSINSEIVRKHPLNQILYGPPGTGKTYHTIIKALEIIGVDTSSKGRSELKKLFDEKVLSGQIVFTTFHQSMCYEDFIEGIKPVLAENDMSTIGYQIEDGIFKTLANKASFGDITKTLNIDEAIEQFKQLCSEQKIELKTSTNKPFYVEYHGNTTFRIYPENTIHEDLGNGYPTSIADVIEYIKTDDLKNSYNSSYVRAIGNYLKSQYKLNLISQIETSKQNFVLIIDEINRGNVSQIFGELITLIEDDKRLGNKEALKVTLPYSKMPFGVPNNLYIIGTMNTADRSVEALDTALRRRFNFTEMLPDSTLLETREIAGIKLVNILDTINQRLERLLDRDHQIGHSYLLNVANSKELSETFNHKIVPLLQEYFFNDYAKIGLVLGSGFVEKIESTMPFAPFDDDSFDLDKPIYRLKKLDENNIIDALNSMKIQSK